MNITKLAKPRARWVTFKLKVAKSVSRSLYDKLTDHGLSVKDFGAKGDGITDDTEAFELAASSGLGSVLIPYSASGYVVNKDMSGFYGFNSQIWLGTGTVTYKNLLQ